MTHTEESKAKIRAALTGIKRSDEFKAKVSAARKGQRFSPEIREQMTKRLREHPPAKGLIRSAEHRANLSKARVGKCFTSMMRYGISREEYRLQRAAGNRWCCHGKHWVPADKVNRQSMCSECAPEFYRLQNLKIKYGVTPDWYDQKLSEQGGVCALCGGGPSKGDKNLAVDHDHQSGKVRGLLCSRCNTTLNKVETIPGWVDRALAYLAKYR